jgi:hypothetical protein
MATALAVLRGYLQAQFGTFRHFLGSRDYHGAHRSSVGSDVSVPYRGSKSLGHTLPDDALYLLRDEEVR